MIYHTIVCDTTFSYRTYVYTNLNLQHHYLKIDIRSCIETKNKRNKSSYLCVIVFVVIDVCICIAVIVNNDVVVLVVVLVYVCVFVCVYVTIDVDVYVYVYVYVDFPLTFHLLSTYFLTNCHTLLYLVYISPH